MTLCLKMRLRRIFKFNSHRPSEVAVLNESEREMYFDLHIWSQYLGSKEVLEIIDLIAAAVPSEWFEEDAQTIFRDESGWYHGIITLKLYDR